MNPVKCMYIVIIMGTRVLQDVNKQNLKLVKPGFRFIFCIYSNYVPPFVSYKWYSLISLVKLNHSTLHKYFLSEKMKVLLLNHVGNILIYAKHHGVCVTWYYCSANQIISSLHDLNYSMCLISYVLMGSPCCFFYRAYNVNPESFGNE